MQWSPEVNARSSNAALRLHTASANTDIWVLGHLEKRWVAIKNVIVQKMLGWSFLKNKFKRFYQDGRWNAFAHWSLSFPVDGGSQQRSPDDVVAFLRLSFSTITSHLRWNEKQCVVGAALFRTFSWHFHVVTRLKSSLINGCCPAGVGNANCLTKRITSSAEERIRRGVCGKVLGGRNVTMMSRGYFMVGSFPVELLHVAVHSK